MTRLLFVAMIVAVLGSASSLDAAERVLFQFDRPEDSRPWRTVNDGVMGGLSDGRISFNTNGRMRFFGTLSLANNGGFASTRASGQDLGLAQGEVVVLRVRGDGREYNFNLYAQRNLGGYSYRQSFRTKAGEWTEVQLPVDKFVATWRGRVFPNERLDPARVAGIGFQLGDKRAGPFQLEIDWIKVRNAQEDVAPLNADCDGVFTHHLQGVCADGEFLYWSFTTSLVKTDLTGKVLLKVPVDNHHGDLCLHEGKLYVAVNLGKFNDPEGNADSWVYVYDADSLNEVARHETQDVFYGAGGIGVREGRFFVVGGLPEDMQYNFVYEYDESFQLVQRHIVESGHTHLGIQTATYANDRWWFGCYGSPAVLLVTDSDFQMLGRYEYDCSLGIAGYTSGRLLVASGKCEKEVGCTGAVRTAIPDDQRGLR